MQISIELQYLHTSRPIPISFAFYQIMLFSVGTLPPNHRIHAIYFLLSYFWYLFLCGAVRVQCSVCKFFLSAVQCSDTTLVVWHGHSAVKVCLPHLYSWLVLSLMHYRLSLLPVGYRT